MGPSTPFYLGRNANLYTHTLSKLIFVDVRDVNNHISKCESSFLGELEK